MATARDVKKALHKIRNPAKAAFFPKFFKTGKGQYGEGDRFLGVTVPQQRKIAFSHRDLPLADVQKLLTSKIHEHRFTALEILVAKFRKADDSLQFKIFEFYLKNTKRINNWDLVDTSARHIIGKYLRTKNRSILDQLARSKSLWERRISIVATHEFISLGEFRDTLRIAKILVKDSHDLIHKAVGWMLREVGNKDEKVLVTFLKRHARKMPRTMLRYAIEKFPKSERMRYMKRD